VLYCTVNCPTGIVRITAVMTTVKNGKTTFLSKLVPKFLPSPNFSFTDYNYAVYEEVEIARCIIETPCNM